MLYTVKSVIKSLPTRGQNLLGDSKNPKTIEWYKEDIIDGGFTGFTNEEAIVVKNLIDRMCKENFFETTVCEVNEGVIPDGLFLENTSDKFPVLYPLEELINNASISSLPFKMEITGFNRFIIEP